jgi:hypothetical protein
LEKAAYEDEHKGSVPEEDKWESYAEAAHAAGAGSASEASYSTMMLEKVNNQWHKQTVTFSGDSGTAIETHSEPAPNKHPLAWMQYKPSAEAFPHKPERVDLLPHPLRTYCVRERRVGEAEEGRAQRAGVEEQPQENGEGRLESRRVLGETPVAHDAAHAARR